MFLCHYLCPDSIICPVQASCKTDILRELTEHLVQTHDLKNGEKIFGAITAREKAGASCLPVGISMPHARCSNVDDIKMVLGIVPDGLQEKFEDDDCTVKVVCLFISPDAESAFTKHLQVLARIAAVFNDERYVDELAQANNGDEAFTILQRFEREAEDRQAATQAAAAGV